MSTTAKKTSAKYLVILSAFCGFVLALSGIKISAQVMGSPTINIDKTKIERGDHVFFSGESDPYSEILISITSANSASLYIKTITTKDGHYFYDFNTTLLESIDDEFYVKSKASLNDKITEFNRPIKFSVKKKSTLNNCFSSGDFNHDCKINLTDISIMANWFEKKSFRRWLILT